MSLPQESAFDSPIEEPHVDLGIYYLDVVQCPLNPNHNLRRHRLPYHLNKCKKNFPDKVACPYGHYFYSNKEEMTSHLKVCPHKPACAQAEDMQPHITEAQLARSKYIKHNYDINNYKTDEPYWD